MNVQELIDAINQQWEERIDKIMAEIKQVSDEESAEDFRWALGLRYSMIIIDKYRKEQA